MTRAPFPDDRLSALVDQLALDAGVPRPAAEKRFDELFRFLDVAATASEPLAPSEPVDEAWHVFLRDRVSYVAFCRTRYGRVLGHNPETDPDKLREWYGRTLTMLGQRFGSVDATIWPARAPAACGLGADEPLPPPPPPR